jgi:hypothetical protein
MKNNTLNQEMLTFTETEHDSVSIRMSESLTNKWHLLGAGLIPPEDLTAAEIRCLDCYLTIELLQSGLQGFAQSDVTAYLVEKAKEAFKQSCSKPNSTA